MKPARFEYVAPRTEDEALAALAQYGDGAKVLAGGQSLIPLMNFRLAQPAVIVDVNRLADLAYVRPADAGLAIGALARQHAAGAQSHSRGRACRFSPRPATSSATCRSGTGARWVATSPTPIPPPSCPR